ncbi:MAG: two-component sensor histidine kinase [Candidatus Dactylopiibacterium carminicum]|nr:MAG: two-component sensor histidine kinase [Candidatus Dactylopiibacterium carminicum]
MSRLFWKLFLTIFVAQVVTVWSVGALFWLIHSTETPEMEFRHFQPPTPQSFPSAPEGRRGGLAEFDRSFDQSRQAPHHPAPPDGPGLPWIPLSVGLIFSLLFAALLARHLSRPILNLSEAFKAVADGDFDVRLSEKMRNHRDELADLGRQFDQTSARLQQVLTGQRRLLHDVSHEMRSPLARIQLAIDIARQQPEKAEASMQRLERETARIDHLVEELLTLSRMESNASLQSNEPLDLVEILQDLLTDARFEAPSHHCHVNYHGPEHATVRGHAVLLHRAIENVVRNAMRHTAQETCVEIVLTQREDMLCLDVMDRGPGVLEGALEIIFEPFVRFAEHGGNDGHGLGLAISRRVMQLHGGSIRARNREGGGLCVEFRLPGAIDRDSLEIDGSRSSAQTRE